MPSRRAFISGPTDCSEAYFTQYYSYRILHAISQCDSFLIGPTGGIDTLALNFLLSQSIDPKQISIYLTEFEYKQDTLRQKYESLEVNIVQPRGAVSTGMRDEAMTRDSDYDILRYRTEKERKDMYGMDWWPRVIRR